MSQLKKLELEKQIRKGRSAVLIVNTRSRKGERTFFAAMDGLAERGIKVAAAYPVRDPARLSEVIKEAIERSHKLVIVGGGDGTVSSVVDFFANEDVVFGLLPLGTGNSFAQTLGIPLDLNGALDVISKGKVASIDLGKADDDYFANVASLGISAELSRFTSRKLKRIVGVLAYLIAGTKIMLEHQAFHCELQLNGRTHKVKTHQLVIANGSVFGVNKILPDAHVDNKRLVVFTMDSLNRWQALKLWISFFLGRPGAFTAAKYFITKRVRITADPPQYVDIDGESVFQTPVTFSVAEEALKVMVPQEFVDID